MFITSHMYKFELCRHAYRICRLDGAVLTDIRAPVDRKSRKTNAVKMVHVLSSPVNYRVCQHAPRTRMKWLLTSP